jgi:hypothetical protein
MGGHRSAALPVAAQIAARILMPGGSLICWSGNPFRDIPILNQYLRPWDMLEMPLDPYERQPGKWTEKTFRSVLWYVKGTRRTDIRDDDHPPWINTRLNSKYDKSDLKWQQGDGTVVEPLINAMTNPGELIVDPSEGTGRWGEVASKLDRRYIGCDVKKGGSEEIRLPPDFATRGSVEIEAPVEPAYDAADDFAKSLDVAYSAIRERQAAGGPGWTPMPAPRTSARPLSRRPRPHLPLRRSAATAG